MKIGILSLFLSVFMGTVAHADSATHVFNLTDLRKLIQEKNIHSVDELIPALPNEVKANHALMHTSQSLQFADPNNPRVILYGLTGTLVLAFSASDQDLRDEHGKEISSVKRPHIATGDIQGGFDEVEVMEFNQKTRAFQLREISFPPNGSLKAVRISEPNPARCLTCHGSDPRPIWGHYDFWPTVYGDVKFKNGSSRAPFPFEKNFNVFLTHFGERARYKTLPDVRENIYGRGQGSAAYLGALLSRWNTRRIMRQIDQNTALKPLIPFLLSLGQEYRDYTPETTKPLLNKYFPATVDTSAILNRIQKINEVRKLQTKDELSEYSSPYYRGIFDYFYSVSDSLGLPISTWSMDFIQGTPESFFTLGSFTSEFLGAFKEAHPELSRFLISTPYHYPFQGNDLELGLTGVAEYRYENILGEPDPAHNGESSSPARALGTASLEKIERAQWTGLFIERLIKPLSEKSYLGLNHASARTTANACMECHNGKNALIPYLPFNHPEAFTNSQLAKIKFRISKQAEIEKEQRMPALGPYLYEFQQKEFMAYLKKGTVN